MKEKICKWKAECTWGDGPDVLLVHEKYPEYPEHNSYYDLNIREAKILACELMNAAHYAEEMNRSVIDYFSEEIIDKETVDIIKKFQNQEDLDPEYSAIVDKHFWDLI